MVLKNKTTQLNITTLVFSALFTINDAEIISLIEKNNTDLNYFTELRKNNTDLNSVK